MPIYLLLDSNQNQNSNSEVMDGTEPLATEPLPPLSWVKPPRQQRSQKTLERLLDAAEDLIIEHGVQALTVSAVVARAKSSVGAFYARFSDKTALLRTLHERECDEALATTDLTLAPARWEGVDLSDALGEITRFVVQLFAERQRLVLAFMSVSATDESFAQRRARLTSEIAARLRRLLDARADEIPHPDLGVASEVSVRILLGTLESEIAVRSALPPEKRHSNERLAAELTRALLGYLGIAISTRYPTRGSNLKGDAP